MNRMNRAGRLLGCVILALLSQLSTRLDAADSLRWRNQMVDADVRLLPLPDLLAEIAAQTGWQIYLEPGLDQPISAKFQQLSLNAAIKALLGNLNFALLPQTNGPAKLYVFETNLQEATQIIQPQKQEKGRAGALSNELVVTLKDGANID